MLCVYICFNHFRFIFPVQNFTVLVFGGVWLMFYGEKVSLNIRILVPQFILIFAMLVVPILNILQIDEYYALRLTLLAQFTGAVCVTIYQSASYGAGGLLGPSVMNSLETGKGVGGVGIILARVISKALLPSTPEGLRMSTNIFFIFSNGLVVLAICLWFVLLNTPYAATKIAGYESQRRANILAATLAANHASPASTGGKNRKNSPKPNKKSINNIEEGSKLLSSPISPPPLSVTQQGREEDEEESSSFLHILWLVSSPATVVTITFIVCLSCFPGLTTSLVSRSLNLGDWFPVLLVLIYNTGDLIGKALPSYKMLLSLDTLPYASIVHLLFIPFFVFIARRPDLSDAFYGFCGTDEFAFFLVFGLGICTGYISCTAMMVTAYIYIDMLEYV